MSADDLVKAMEGLSLEEPIHALYETVRKLRKDEKPLLESNDLEGVAKYILEHDVKNIVVVWFALTKAMNL